MFTTINDYNIKKIIIIPIICYYTCFVLFHPSQFFRHNNTKFDVLIIRINALFVFTLERLEQEIDKNFN